MYNLCDENDDKLDSNYSIELVEDGFDLIIESRGGSTGGREPRNPDYSKALELHLQRMAELGMVLGDLQVASRGAMKLAEEKRQIRPEGYVLPLDLKTVSDFTKLRLAIERIISTFRSNAKKGKGSQNKRLRLRMRWVGAASMSTDSIARMLSTSRALEKPTDDPRELSDRVDRARERMRSDKRMHSEGAAPPKGQDEVQKVTSHVDRHVRDPEIIAWILEKADGKCENCGSPAPFKKNNGEYFLEVHHVRPLGEGGPDTIENTVACCPNCHRQLHYDPARDSLRLKLIKSVPRLKEFPVRA